MKPTVAVDIVSKDKSDKGFHSAEKRAGAFAKTSREASEKSGLKEFGKGLAGLSKFKELSLDRPGRSLVDIAEGAERAGAGVGRLTSRVFGFGGVAKGAMGEAAEAVGGFAGAAAGATVVVAGLAAATYGLGENFAKSGAGIGRQAKTLALAAQDLQAIRAAGEREGVSADQTDASIEGLGDVLEDAKIGRNNEALGTLNALGVKLKETKDGALDVTSALYDISDAIARQKDPLVQRKLAGLFGVSGMLPALRRGSAALKEEGADYQAGGGGFSDEEIEKAEKVERSTVRAKQQAYTTWRKTNIWTMGAAGFMADKGVGIARTGGKAFEGLPDAVRGLAHSGVEAGRSLVHGAEAAAQRLEGRAAELGEGGRRALGLTRQAAGRAAQAMTYFMSQGESPEQAAGIVANLIKESGLNPRARGDSGLAYGLGQWHPDRQAAFAKFAGHDIRQSSFEEQLAFVQHELSAGTERRAGAALRAADTAYEAGAIVSRRYERPRYADAEARARGDLAEKLNIVIDLRGAPAGTVAHVEGGRSSQVAMNVQHAMEGP
jgi:hypothetical protein